MSREFELMRALEAAGTGHYQTGKIIDKENGNKFVYFLTEFDEVIKQRLIDECKKIKGLDITFKYSRSVYAPELENMFLVRNMFT